MISQHSGFAGIGVNTWSTSPSLGNSVAAIASILRAASCELTANTAVTASQSATPAANARGGVARQASRSIATITVISVTAGSSGTRPLNQARPMPIASTAATIKRASSVRNVNTSGAQAAHRSGSAMNTASP
jgi:hypothetical protein